MRILEVVPHYLPAIRFGGPLQVAHQLGRALVAKGHEVTVCTTDLKEPGARLDVPVGAPVLLDGIRVFYERVRWLERWGFSPGLLPRMADEVSRADLVLVHDHFQFAGWVGTRAARAASRPYVLFPHSSLRRSALRRGHSWMKAAYVRLLLARAAEEALFVAFNAEEELVDSFGAERGVVVPNGVDVDGAGEAPTPGAFRRAHPECGGKILFGFLGRLDVRQKGLDALVEAFAKVAAEREDVHLVIAGPTESDGRPVVEELVRRAALELRVTFTGLLGPTEKAEFLRDLDVFTLMSRYEGASIALLEAMAAGVPVLVTDSVGLCGEIGRAGAGFVTRFSPDGLESALRKALDAGWRVSAGRNARALVRERFTWDRIAGRLLEEVEARLAGRKTRGGAWKP